MARICPHCHGVIDGVFNPDMLKIARYVRALPLEELATMAGIDQGTLSRYENGLSVPTASDIARLVEALDFPHGWFHREGHFGRGGVFID